MDYDEWEQQAARWFAGDALWNITAYRIALFVADCTWDDAIRLAKHRIGSASLNPLVRAVGSIGADIAECYSRSTGLDRARFFEYALGSVRESRHWYYSARRALPAQRVTDILTRTEQRRRLLLVMVHRERRRHRRISDGDDDAPQA